MLRGLGLLVTAEERLENSEEVDVINPIETGDYISPVEHNEVLENSVLKEEKKQNAFDGDFNEKEDSSSKNESSSRRVRSLVKEAAHFIHSPTAENGHNEAVLPATSSARKRWQTNYFRN